MEARLPSRLRASWSLSLSSLSFTTILVLLTFVLLPAVAQNVQLLPTAASSTFPACALQCTTLQQAQTGCVPPAAPVTDQAIYVSCFCQSALLTTLHTSADSVCNTQCTSTSDRQLLTTWYQNYCSSGGKDGGEPTTTTTAAAAPATAKSTTSTATANLYPAPPSWYVEKPSSPKSRLTAITLQDLHPLSMGHHDRRPCRRLQRPRCHRYMVQAAIRRETPGPLSRGRQRNRSTG
jgi:hypothetical protein